MDESGTEHHFRWRRWLGLALVSLPIFLLLFHYIWGALMTRGLQAQLNALRAAGEPTLPADFVTPNADSPENGGPDILAAGEILMLDKALWDGKTLDDPAPPLRDDERQAMQSALERDAKAIELIESGSAKRYLEWKLDLTGNASQRLLESKDLSRVRGCATLLKYAALLDHDHGDDAGALQRLEQMLVVSRFAEKNPTLVGHLVAVGCAAMTADTAMKIAPDLNVNPTTTRALRRVIDQLLDDKPSIDGMALALRGERVMSIEMLFNGMPATSGATGWNPAAKYVMKPILGRNARLIVDHLTKMIPVSQAPNLPAAKAKLPPMPARSMMNVFVNMLLPSLDRTITTEYRVRTERRLAATALAIRWYAVEHGGQLPQRLDDLVPKYLPSVPMDLMIAATALHYQPLVDKPLLYSVGEDEVDDGGSEQAINPRLRRPPSSWEMKDRVLHLDRQPRPPKETDEEEKPPAPATAQSTP